MPWRQAGTPSPEVPCKAAYRVAITIVYGKRNLLCLKKDTENLQLNLEASVKGNIRGRRSKKRDAQRVTRPRVRKSAQKARRFTTKTEILGIIARKTSFVGQ